MTTLDTLRDSLPDYARDLKLNLGSVLSLPGAPGLTERQIWAVALGAAEASRNPAFAAAIGDLAAAHLDAAYQTGARAAAAIMGMNNVYYRFLHLVDDPEYARMPARLRMNVIGNPGMDKVDFELISLGSPRSTAAAPAWPRTSGRSANTACPARRSRAPSGSRPQYMQLPESWITSARG
jgi:alkyl hydroperoxide reductase subunit D